MKFLAEGMNKWALLENGFGRSCHLRICEARFPRLNSRGPIEAMCVDLPEPFGPVSFHG